jgi:hypothetical protein
MVKKAPLSSQAKEHTANLIGDRSGLNKEVALFDGLWNKYLHHAMHRFLRHINHRPNRLL